MMNFNSEMIEKAKAAKSAEELLALAKENGVEMTEEEAATNFAQLNPKSGELDDDELDAVAGGACNDPTNADLFPVGAKVRRISGPCKCGCNVWTVESDKITYYARGASTSALNPRCDSCGAQDGAKQASGSSMTGKWELI